MKTDTIPHNQIRAMYDADTIRVYQAYSVCRAGWGLKDEGQKRILAIDITREGFEWAAGPYPRRRMLYAMTSALSAESLMVGPPLANARCVMRS